jgi:ABC-type xylose transport system permease subunit
LVFHTHSQVWLLPDFVDQQKQSAAGYLAIGQAIIVIAGGVDLSLGSLLLLANVIAARFMEGQPVGIVFVIGVALILGIALLNGLTGYVITLSGVPDIVVTLAASYIWSGLALWILPSPGGGTAPEMRWLFTGSESGIGGSYILPILMMLLPAILVFLLARRSRIGLSDLCDWQQQCGGAAGWVECAPGKDRLLCGGRGDGRAGRAGDCCHHRHGRPALQRRCRCDA